MRVKTVFFFIIIFLFFLTSLLVSISSEYVIYNKLVGFSILVFWIIFSRRLVFPIFFNRYLLFVIFAIIASVIVDANWVGVWGEARTMLQLVVLLLVIYNISFSLKFRDNLRFISSFLIIYFIFSYFGYLIGFGVTELNSGDRMSGVTANPNALAFSVLYGLIAFLYIIESQNNWLIRFFRNHWYLIFLGTLLLLLPTGSRKSLIAFGGVFLFYTLIKQRNILKSFIGLTLIMILIVFFFWDIIMMKFELSIMGERFLNEDTLSSGASIRKHLYEQAIDIFLQHPIFGVGLGNFRFISESGHVSHSYYMEILACTGIIGFLILFSIYYQMGLKTYFLYKNYIYENESNFIFNFLFLTVIMSFGFSYHISFIHWFVIAFIFSFLDSIELNPDIN